MQVKISDWAWLPLGEYPASKLDRLKERLTIQPRRTSLHQDVDPDPILLFRENENCIGIPRGFFVQQNKQSGRSHEICDEMSYGRSISLRFNGELKDDQRAGLAAVLEDRELGNYGSILQASPGWGKTVGGLAIWTAFKTTAIVIVHKTYLIDQWMERIKQFVPDARVGRIQGDLCEYGDDFDISIATIQTLSSRAASFSSEFWSSFGLVITDEVHRIGAPTWGAVVPMFRAVYRLGLSATPRRIDGAEDVFLLHIGPVVYRSKAKRQIPKLRRIFTDFKPIKTRSFDFEKVSKEIQLRHICKSPLRNKLIVLEIDKAIKAGRKVMVLSERRMHLELLKEKYDEIKETQISTGLYLGGMKQEELDEAELSDVVFSTYQMAREALDIPSLDTLFLATPIRDVEQAVGRIMREYKGKKQPIVTDFIDESVSRFKKLWNARRVFYIKEGMFSKEKEK